MKKSSADCFATTVPQGGDSMNGSEQIEMKTATISGVNVFSTLDDQIMVAQSIPGNIDVFFRPYNFCPKTDELRAKLEALNQKLRTEMTCDLSNKGKGIIHLEYNPLVTSMVTIEQFVGGIVLYLYECNIRDDYEPSEFYNDDND